MGNISKNSRKRVSQKNFCRCGGEVKMFNVFKEKGLRLTARCGGCGSEARKPKSLR